MKKVIIPCALVLALTSNFLLGFPYISSVCASSPQRFDEQIASFIDEAREASAAGEHKTLVLTLSEEDIARQLAEMVERNKEDIPVRVKDIRVHFGEGSRYIQVTAKVKYFFFGTKVSADVLITPEGRHGYYEVVDLSVGHLSDTLIDWIMQKVPYELSGPLPLGGLPVELQDIYLRDGRLYVEAITVPAK